MIKPTSPPKAQDSLVARAYLEFRLHPLDDKIRLNLLMNPQMSRIFSCAPMLPHDSPRSSRFSLLPSSAPVYPAFQELSHNPSFVFPEEYLQLHGDPLQLRVWATMRSILPGTTLTYGKLAELVGKPHTFRHLANVCGQNELALLVPCHRIVGAHNLGGFAWGPALKEKLLAREGVMGPWH